MSEEIEKIKEEIKKTKIELTMSHMNDGWWIKAMNEKLIELNSKLKKLLEK